MQKHTEEAPFSVIFHLVRIDDKTGSIGCCNLKRALGGMQVTNFLPTNATALQIVAAESPLLETINQMMTLFREID